MHSSVLRTEFARSGCAPIHGALRRGRCRPWLRAPYPSPNKVVGAIGVHNQAGDSNPMTSTSACARTTCRECARPLVPRECHLQHSVTRGQLHPSRRTTTTTGVIAPRPLAKRAAGPGPRWGEGVVGPFRGQEWRVGRRWRRWHCAHRTHAALQQAAPLSRATSGADHVRPPCIMPLAQSTEPQGWNHDPRVLGPKLDRSCE